MASRGSTPAGDPDDAATALLPGSGDGAVEVHAVRRSTDPDRDALDVV